MKNTMKKVILVEIGMALNGIGTAMFFSSGIGSASMATFCDGIHYLLNITQGTSNILVNAIFFLILLAIGKEYIGIGTVLCAFTAGFWIDLSQPLFTMLIHAYPSLFIKILLSICGSFSMGIGLGLYVSQNIGLGALEGILDIICKKKYYSLRAAKILEDSTLVIAGILLNASWGVGTLIGIFLTGPIMQKSYQHFVKKQINEALPLK